jgi:hypothetical protein
MDDKTYSARLPVVVEDALMPLNSFKELLIDLDEPGLTVKPVHVAVVLETLIEASQRKLKAMEGALDAGIGRVSFQRATVRHPTAKTGEIVGIEVEPFSPETAKTREVVNG